MAAETPSLSALAQVTNPRCAYSVEPSAGNGYSCHKVKHESFGDTGSEFRNTQRTSLSSLNEMLMRPFSTVTQKQCSFPLNEETLVKLIDAGLRRCICPDAMNLSTGIRAVHEGQKLPLCEFAPNIFNRGYSQKFEEQAIFIAGIASILASLWPTANQNPAKSRNLVRSDTSDVDTYNHRSQAKELLRNDLWVALANGIRIDKSRRRLSPLSSVRGSVHGEHSGGQPSMESSMVTQNMDIEYLWEGLAKDQEEIFDGETPPAIEVSPVSERLGRHGFLDQSSISGVTSTWNHGIQDVTTSGCYDANFEAEGLEEVDVNNFFLEADISTCQPDQRRSRTQSSTQGSDVSMLTAIVRMGTDTTQEAHDIEPPGVIGRQSSLTQNVIRMHPLRKRERAEYGAHSNDLEERGATLYESTVSQGIGNVSYEEPFATTESFDSCSGQNTPLEPKSSTTITDCGLISIFQDAIYDSAEDEYILDFPMTLSTTESEQLTNSSLSDVLGNDHLLWHMWKRRASVAPRGQEDVEDMRTLYESDPDMKLFGKGWCLGTSDMSPSSNEDPMLQELTTRTRKSSSSASPMSDRRSYFGPTRSTSSSSSSSSSSTGQATSDPKLQRRGSIMKRFSWGGRQHATELIGLEMTNLNGRDFEVKRRRTMDDYAMMEKETNSDDSHDMLF